MKKYLVDANLPYFISLWNTPEFIHLNDIDTTWTDEHIWDYAQEHNLTIISKDSDFSHRIILTEPPPRIIHIRLGNMSIKQLRRILIAHWDSICAMSESCKLVNVFHDHIEGVK